jgi:hypothetical protein
MKFGATAVDEPIHLCVRIWDENLFSHHNQFFWRKQRQPPPV